MPNITIYDSDCIVYLDKEHIDKETDVQIKKMMSHVSVSKPRIMPDCHAGNGCCIGFTCHLTKYVSPHLIGGDIGCGVSAYKISSQYMQKKKALDNINNAILEIPMGKNLYKTPIIQEEQFDNFFDTTQQNAINFIDKYKQKFNIDITEYMPKYDMNWLKSRCEIFKFDFNKIMSCIGTLGGCNHFIELDTNGEDYYLVAHTGSRLLGKAIYSYWSQNYEDGEEEDEKEFDEKHILTDKNSYLYFFDMLFAQQFAVMNRNAILSYIIYLIGLDFDSKNIIQSIHNFIDFDDLIIRKGAIRSYENEKCIIALNMKEGIIIADGLSNEEWNNSAPHGCGRIISRSVAMKSITNKDSLKFALKKYKEELGETICDTISADTLAERPSAYRDYNIVLDSIKDKTVTNIEKYHTLVVAKGK
jgi:tRNA-splicing ligase RtcB